MATLGIKVDVDTYRGMEAGVPELLRIFARHRIGASFFIAMGPDNSGKAVLRFFTRRGFLKKMLRSNAVRMYGLRTALSGTLLPARRIARSFPGLLRALLDEGHEVGIHGHDHVRWHDRIPAMSPAEAREELEKALRTYREIAGRDAESSAAPGWACSPAQLAAQDEYPMKYHSDARGAHPFFPAMGGYRARHLQVPTTLPTLDEALSSGPPAGPDDIAARYISSINAGGLSVLTVHAEAEGMGWSEWFDRLLEELGRRKVRFARLREIADEALADPGRVPRCEIVMGELPGRAGNVAIQGRRCM